MVAAAVTSLLFLPLTVIGTNDSMLLQPQSAFAQEQQGGGNQSSVGNQSSGGQPQGEEAAFLPYLNPVHGIFMQYPSNWIASTSGLADYTELVAFYSPLQNLSDLFPARLAISVIIYSQDISLQEYTDSVFMILNQSGQADVRSSSEVSIAGYPGHRVVLAVQPFQNSTLTFHQMNTWTTIGNKVYLLTYEGGEPVFNQHLSEVSRMLETLAIRSNNMTTSTAEENQIE